MKKKLVSIVLAIALFCMLLPSVTPRAAAAYLDSCTKYKTSIIVKTTKETYLMSQPCSNGTDSSSTVVVKAAAGETLTVVAMYKNTYGNYWYQIAGKSAKCFAYSGDTTFQKYNKTNDLTTDGMTVTWAKGRPRVIQTGVSFSVDGTVKSAYSTITQVATYVYSGEGVLSGTPKISAVCSDLSTSSFDIAANKTNTGLKFENLTAEGMYTYSIKANVKYSYCNNGTTKVDATAKDQDVYHVTFRTVKKYSTPKVSVSTANERINTLVDKLVGKYFTKAGDAPCYDPPESGHGCEGCNMTKVICKTWLLELLDWKVPVYSIQGSITHYTATGTATNGQSCCGFANFAGWYIFAEDAGNKVTFEKHFSGPMTKATLQHAQPGDVLRATDMFHSMIFIKANDSNFTVLDCNYGSSTYGQCIIRKHNISYNSSDTITISRAKNYDIPTYTVKYDANGGSGAPSSQTKYKNEPLTLSKTTPTRTGYTFVGWATTATATKSEYSAGATYTTNANLTLYAVWKQSACSHTYTYTVGTAPTLSESGTLTGTCSKCGNQTTVALPTLNTTDYTYSITKAATCTETGMGRYTWKTTTYGTFYFDVTIAKIAHTYAQTVTAPTCTEQGFTTHTCTGCGDSYKDTYTDALGHDWDGGTITTQPTETTDGVKTFTCSRCCATKTESIPALNHTHSYTAAVTLPTCTEKGYTTYTCSCGDSYVADYVDALGHNFVGGVCTRCGAKDPNYVPPTPGDPCEGYTDIDRSKWYHSAADFVIARGLMGSTKTDSLTFEPDTKVSRAMVASILYRMANSPAVTYKGTFTDVKNGKWFTDAIEWCAQNGLASGKGNGKFDPNGNVTRQELAVFMMKMTQYLGKPTEGRADLGSFADGASVPKWASDYVKWAVSAGLISGKSSGGKTYLAPTDNATRAEFASIIMRFVQNIAEAK